eukprot:CAMPEP_0201910172 /NCGR_PEP_ID=MMETSP0903-20130614/1642_1 /ASSEMBLY_ACC=CAM_ASM_000552 /TAXON_ID=420261 /ORGANISM="Thalassiosira antarctica, Strain CCMP982" /LENGTH=77 /DNA_ID=CAMNT_0048444769 /DNA_START=536 /DNA_END=765 /DNA_ORIENTATION=+
MTVKRLEKSKIALIMGSYSGRQVRGVGRAIREEIKGRRRELQDVITKRLMLMKRDERRRDGGRGEGDLGFGIWDSSR